MSEWWSAFLEIFVILPGIVMCLVPVKKWLKPTHVPILIILVPITILVSALAAALHQSYSLSVYAVFVPAMLVSIVLYFLMVRLEKAKLFFLFINTMGVLSFGTLLANLFEAAIDPTGGSETVFGPWGLAALWAYTLIAMLVFVFVLRRRIDWMLVNFNISPAWVAAGLLPGLTVFVNWMLIPQDYSTMAVARLREIGWTLWVVMLLLFILLQVLFYIIAYSSNKRMEAEKKVQLTDVQRAQYEALQVHLLETERLRHDFRHTVRTISELCDSGNYEELKAYLEAYRINESRDNLPLLFCENYAANALLRSYARMAQEEKTAIDWKVYLPTQLPVSDVDLCVILGNLLENGILSGRSLPPEKRRVRLKVDTDTPGELYIVMVNAFDGHTRQQDGRFLSTRKTGKGVGLPSVRAIAERYDGMARFYADGYMFHSEVMLRLCGDGSETKEGTPAETSL